NLFHPLPDGMGTFKTDDGGFILACNSEMPYIAGIADIGTAAIRFDKDFNVTAYYPILKQTHINCAGGVTPWGTWLSCEEIPAGKVFECDPYGVKPAVARPAMGVFKHEAASVDPVGKKAYLTEDEGSGCFYRFNPDNYPDLSSGTLDVASVQDDGTVKWLNVPDPQFQGAVPTRQQVPEATTFRRGEGMWYDEGIVYFATTQDDRVYAYHCATEELEVLYDGVALGDDAPLHDTDNVTVSPISGDLYVCEDADDLQVCLISAEGEVAPFAQCPGDEHANSELTGPVFDPTGKRFYFASQRDTRGGVIYEISGPFRRTRAEDPPDPGPDPDPEPEPKDRKKPRVKVRTLGKPSLRRLLRSGQPFRLTINDQSPPVDLEIRLVTKLRRAAGKGSRQVTIGRLNTKAGKPGDKRIRVKVGNRYKKRLRKRDVAQARLIVVATDKAGNRRKVTKPVRFS
ncbi:MAG: PhoX family protein, partial [Actinomycetota bacterium]|nr:PhoX family protein [Actinomycetota bacterium]